MHSPAVPPARPTDDLFEFAWIPARGDVPANKGYESRLRELATKAQHEPWSFDPAKPFDILGNYFRYTFKQLAREAKVEEAVDPAGSRIAAFNTGLFTPNFEPIFALFEANRDQTRQPWVFKDFVVEFDRRFVFEQRPRPARYFKNTDELIYDPDRELIPNLEHILDENVERYPEVLQKNSHLRRQVLQSAVIEAGKRAQMNYTVAVPQSYFGHGGAEPGRIQLLLPLYLENSDRADLALVLEREERAYRAFTVLPLDRAYNNARLITKPQSNWLPIAQAEPERPTELPTA
jgi:uncharacterized protein DUF3825